MERIIGTAIGVRQYRWQVVTRDRTSVPLTACPAGELGQEDANRFEDVHLQNLIDKGYTDHGALKDATRDGLQSPPPLLPALVDKLLKCFKPAGLQDSGPLGMEEIQMLAAFAKDHMKKSHSVRLSDLDASQWGHIRNNAGLLLKPYLEEVRGLELQSAIPFQWSEAPELSQASQYLHHIGSHIHNALSDQKYCMYDAQRYRTLLTVTGMQAELGFAIRGTTDAALVLQQSISVGAAANGIRWLWELKRQLPAQTGSDSAKTASTLPSPGSPGSSSDKAEETDAVGTQSKAACQAMAALLLANIHAPDFRPAITLTDLQDSHSIFWLDGFSIMYYAAPDAATAWALTNALLARDSEGHSSNPSVGQLPHSLLPFAKRQKLDVHGMRSSGAVESSPKQSC
ncbi:hypothetical protein WJX77_007151 [Trebouxia sp. C0004]